MPLRASVVGAGVVGLYTALALAGLGYEVVVYEAVEPGAGASTRNANVLHVVQPPPGRNRRRLARAGARLHRICAERLGYTIMETRLIIPALTPIEEAMLPVLGAALKALAPHATGKILSRSQALELEPALTRLTRRAVMVDGYGVVDSRELLKTLVEAIGSTGSQILKGTVSRITPRGLQFGDGTLEEGYSIAVNAAGEGAARLAEASGAGSYKVDLIGGIMKLYSGPSLESIIAPFPRPGPGKGGALIPQLDGRLLAGPSWGSPKGGLWRRYFRLLSEPPERQVAEVRGVRTVARKRDFILTTQYTPGLRAVHLIGIESPGLTAAPALAVEVLKALGFKDNEFCGMRL